MKQFPLCALVSGALALVTQLVAAEALAQGVKDQLGTVTKKPVEAEGRPAWMKKMAGSSVDLSTYVGSGSFYATKWSNPYVSMAVFVRPTYDLGTRFKLSANARIYVEEELTMPDVPNGRRFSPYDIWLWLSAKELHTFAGPKIRLGGVARLVVPISYESRYAHMVTGMAGGFSLTRPFEFGSAPTAEGRWVLAVVVSSVFTKYLYTSDLRGSPPGDSTGCRPFVPGGLAAGSAGGPAASEGDRCGGPVNTNFALTSSGTLSLTHGKWNMAVILLIANSFRYRIAENVAANLPESAMGRADTTWGIVSLTYSVTDHFGVSVGLSSYQPALDSQYRRLRFPFFDTDTSGSAVANNFTQAFVSLSGTL